MTTYRRLLAQATVSDLATAEPWFTTLFERAPDARPMDGLVEWHLGDDFGVQVWQEPERAGRATLMLEIDDLDGAVERVSAAGLEHDGVQDGGGGRLLVLLDPDGTRVVLFEDGDGS